MGGCTALAAIGWLLGGYRLSSLLVFLGLLCAPAAHWWADRGGVSGRGPRGGVLFLSRLPPRGGSRAAAPGAGLGGPPRAPPGGLPRLEQAAELVEFRATPATEPLYTFNPFAEEGLAGLFVTHPPVAERIRRLRELDPDWRDKLRAA